MKWTWQDVQDLPSDVYGDLVDWLNDDSGEESIELGA